MFVLAATHSHGCDLLYLACRYELKLSSFVVGSFFTRWQLHAFTSELTVGRHCSLDPFATTCTGIEFVLRVDCPYVSAYPLGNSTALKNPVR